MILVFLVDLVTPNQMPFTVCFYVASFSRSLGGGAVTRPPPPPAGSKLAQTPAGARVNIEYVRVIPANPYFLSKFAEHDATLTSITIDPS